MKSLIIYYSIHNNNTEKIAKVFAKTIDCDLINIRHYDDKKIDIENYQLIGFGSGVYKEDLSSKIYKLLDKLDLKDKNTFVFSTSGVGMKFYNNGLIKQLESKGAINKGSFACKGNYRAKEFTDRKIFHIMSRLADGHPNDKDLKEVEKFIASLVDLL